MTQSKREIKAWAILHKSHKYIADDDNGHLYIYDKEPEWYTAERAVPCTITYSLPKKLTK